MPRGIYMFVLTLFLAVLIACLSKAAQTRAPALRRLLTQGHSFLHFEKQ